MERKVRLLAALLFLALTACNPSQISANAKVTVDGTVSRQGSPVSGARVALGKEADAGDVFFGVVSIGLTCLEQQFSACKAQRVTTTSSSGSFAFALKGSDTQGDFGNASVLDLATSLPRTGDELAGPGVNTRFQVQTEHVTETLSMWEPTVSVGASAGAVHVRWIEPPASVFPAEADLGTMHRSVVFQGADAEDVWTADGHAGGADFDARLLEDSTGGVVVFSSIARIKVPPARGTDVEVQARSARYAYASLAGVPISRGKPCSVPDADGNPILQSPCPVTDGHLGSTSGLTPCSSASPTPMPTTGAPSCREYVTIDLGRTVPVTLVVIRGCEARCTVEGSSDDRTWRTIGTNANGSDVIGPRSVAMPVQNAPARFVRVTSGNLNQLREVSVWDHEKVQGSGSLLVAAASIPKGRLTNMPAPKSSRRWWVIAAAIAVAIAIALAGFALGRRRGATGPSSPSSSRGTP